MEIPAYFLFGYASPKGKLKQLSRDARLALGESKKAISPLFLDVLYSWKINKLKTQNTETQKSPN